MYKWPELQNAFVGLLSLSEVCIQDFPRGTYNQFSSKIRALLFSPATIK